MFGEEINKVAQGSSAKVKLLKTNKVGYLFSALLAGIYVGFGVFLIFTIGGVLSSANSPFTKVAMGVSFGIALSLVVFAGSELFTGNNFVMTIGVLKKTSTLGDAIKIWIFSFIGNLLGSMIMGYMIYSTGLASGAIGKFIVSVAGTKMSIPAHELIVRGILCNMLVCLAIWCSFKMKEEVGKLIMIFWCLFAFITSGFEHSVANMTLLTVSLLIPHGDAVTIGGFIYNIGLATLGNFIGGAVFLAIPYYFISKDR